MLRECNYGDYDGESLMGVERRIANFLDEVKSKYNGKTIATVAHRTPQLAIDVLTKKGYMG